jgi:hypothetical protein
MQTLLNHPSFVAFTAPPVAETGKLGVVGRLRATVTGIVTPDGSATGWYFQYARSGVPKWARTKESFSGSGGSPIRITATVVHLRPASKYRYRLVAVNPGGIATGAIRSFTTKR